MWVGESRAFLVAPRVWGPLELMVPPSDRRAVRAARSAGGGHRAAAGRAPGRDVWLGGRARHGVDARGRGGLLCPAGVGRGRVRGDGSQRVGRGGQGVRVASLAADAAVSETQGWGVRGAGWGKGGGVEVVAWILGGRWDGAGG